MKHENFNQPLSYPVDITQLRRNSDFYSRYGKRMLDLSICIFLSPLLIPLIFGLALLTVLDGGFPFFGHSRIGRDGHSFRCWKIRTMVVNADEKLRHHLAQCPHAAAEWQSDFKLVNDPRITRIGGFLRRSSLDELPQLLNVFLGQMSFVGPRPIVLAELAKYGAYAPMYKSMKPGVTGLWQVSGRNDLSYDRRVELDARYARRISLSSDLKIIARTAGSVASMSGR
ncbi:MAG: sugar transferase [Sulfitobacter sp.]